MIEKNKKDFGSLRIDSDQLPDIKDWEVGKKYTLEVEVEMTGIRKPEQYEMGGETVGIGSNKEYKPKEVPKGLIKGDFKITDVSVDDDDTDEESVEDRVGKRL